MKDSRTAVFAGCRAAQGAPCCSGRARVRWHCRVELCCRCCGGKGASGCFTFEKPASEFPMPSAIALLAFFCAAPRSTVSKSAASSRQEHDTRSRRCNSTCRASHEPPPLLSTVFLVSLASVACRASMQDDSGAEKGSCMMRKHATQVAARQSALWAHCQP